MHFGGFLKLMIFGVYGTHLSRKSSKCGSDIVRLSDDDHNRDDNNPGFENSFDDDDRDPGGFTT
jgi:hypothetical protein